MKTIDLSIKNYRKQIYNPTDCTDKARNFSTPSTPLGRQSKTTMNIIFFYPKIRQNYPKIKKNFIEIFFYLKTTKTISRLRRRQLNQLFFKTKIRYALKIYKIKENILKAMSVNYNRRTAMPIVRAMRDKNYCQFNGNIV